MKINEPSLNSQHTIIFIHFDAPYNVDYYLRTQLPIFREALAQAATELETLGHVVTTPAEKTQKGNWVLQLKNEENEWVSFELKAMSMAEVQQYNKELVSVAEPIPFVYTEEQAELDKKVLMTISDEKFGIDLAKKVSSKLKKNKIFWSGGGMGSRSDGFIFNQTNGSFTYGILHESNLESPLQEFANETDFVTWLSQQSNRSMVKFVNSLGEKWTEILKETLLKYTEESLNF